MSGGHLHKAIRQRDYNGAIDLLEGGYQPTPAEWAELREAMTFRRGRSQRTQVNLEKKVRAKLRYRELRTMGVPVEAALETLDSEFSFHRSTLRYVVEGKDDRVNQLIAKVEDP